MPIHTREWTGILARISENSQPPLNIKYIQNLPVYNMEKYMKNKGGRKRRMHIFVEIC